jgi:hypothetical protein
LENFTRALEVMGSMRLLHWRSWGARILLPGIGFAHATFLAFIYKGVFLRSRQKNRVPSETIQIWHTNDKIRKMIFCLH